MTSEVTMYAVGPMKKPSAVGLLRLDGVLAEQLEAVGEVLEEARVPDVHRPPPVHEPAEELALPPDQHDRVEHARGEEDHAEDEDRKAPGSGRCS